MPPIQFLIGHICMLVEQDHRFIGFKRAKTNVIDFISIAYV